MVNKNKLSEIRFTKEKIRALKILLRVVKSSKFGPGKYMDGLCIILWNGEITEKFSQEVSSYLESIIPERRRYDGYVWPAGLKLPRIAFLEEKILTNEKQLRRLEKKRS